MSIFDQVTEQARTVYRAQFKRMAGHGVPYSLAILPVTDTRHRIGVLIEPTSDLEAGLYPGARILVCDVHARTEEQTVGIFRVRMRSEPLHQEHAA